MTIIITPGSHDILIGIDTSASMALPGLSGKSRWQEARETANEVAAGLARIGVRPHIMDFGGAVEVLRDQHVSQVDDLFTGSAPAGDRLLHGMIAQALNWQRQYLNKTVAIILTDGAPDFRDLVAAMLRDAANGIEAEDDLSFLFVQLGDDPDATGWLAALNDAPTRFDIVGYVRAADALAMDPLDLLNRNING